MNQKSFSLKDDEEFDFDFDSPRRKPIIRKGRRSGSSTSGVSNAAFEVNDNNHSAGRISPKSSVMPVLQSRTKKNGGWAEGSTSSSTKMNWLRKMSRSSPLKDSPKKEDKSNADSDNEIPVIPDLEDVYQEEISTQIANAPNINMHRVMTYQELDNDLTKNAVFQSLDGIDLRLLTKHLASANKVKEDDLPWTWDMLFTDVSSHLLEHEKKSEAKDSIADELKRMSINANDM